MHEGYPDEQDPAPTPEKKSVPQLETLPAELGFIENDELLAARHRILEAFASGDSEGLAPHLSDLYQVAGHEELDKIDSTASELRALGQIGLLVARANIYFQAGQLGRYRSLLNDAYTYADNMRYDEIATRIQEVLDEIPETE